MNWSQKCHEQSCAPERIERIKILFQYSFMLFGSGLLGMLLPSCFSQGTKYVIWDTIFEHFSFPFSASSGWWSKLSLVASSCAMDWILMGISFLFAFSILNYLISDIVLTLIGLRFGIGISMLWWLIGVERNGFFVRWSHFVTFLCCKLLVILCLFLYSYLLTFYSYKIKSSFVKGRAFVRSEHLIPLLGSTILGCVVIFLIHACYGWIIFSISK